MKIAAAHVRAVDVPLARPYAITGHHHDAAQFALVRLVGEDGMEGHGLAAPAEEVTGETRDAALSELLATAPILAGQDAAAADVWHELQRRVRGKAALAALDMALCDLAAKATGRPLVDTLGRKHDGMPTSVTIGIKGVDATLDEAEEWLGRGFVALKVKVGESIDEDLERLARLRERLGPQGLLFADANQGYGEREMLRLGREASRLALAMIEQPMAPGCEPFLRTLPQEVQAILCADESAHDEPALRALVAAGCPYGLVNIKLQKCGGPRAAHRLAAYCGRVGIRVLWGCNDESALGIAAALHVAYASSATCFLDLDGSLDLARDPFDGGFLVRQGRLYTMAAPGLGAVPVAP